MDRYVLLNRKNCCFWTKNGWTANVTEAHIFSEKDTKPRISGCKKIPVDKGSEYPSEVVIFERLTSLIKKVFPDAHIVTEASSKFQIPCLTVEGLFTVVWDDECTRVMSETFDKVLLEPGYQVSRLTYDPGVWRYPDGSGQPPECDVEDIGSPHKTPECAAREVVALVAQTRLDAVLEYEADKEAERAMEEFDRAREAYERDVMRRTED